MPDSLEITEPAIFADDTSLTATGETPAEIQNKPAKEGNPERFDMVKCKQTNVKRRKTEYMLIGSTKRLKQIKNDPIIEIKDHVIR